MKLSNLTKSLQKILKRNHLRVTQPRLAIIKVLEKNQDRFLTSEELFHLVQQSDGPHCDKVSVYRILNTFKKLNIVTKSDFCGEASKFRLSPNLFSKGSSHQHFFRCLHCNDIKELEECLVEQQIRHMETQGYKNIGHHLEMSGICPSCANP